MICVIIFTRVHTHMLHTYIYNIHRHIHIYIYICSMILFPFKRLVMWFCTLCCCSYRITARLGGTVCAGRVQRQTVPDGTPREARLLQDVCFVKFCESLVLSLRSTFAARWSFVRRVREFDRCLHCQELAMPDSISYGQGSNNPQQTSRPG